MKLPLRAWANRTFTLLAILSTALIVAVLVVILLPMAWRGGGAVVFRGTVEFRRMQLEQFGRGDYAALQRELAASADLRRRAYSLYDRFAQGLDTTRLEDEAGDIYRELGRQLENRQLPREQHAALRSLSRQLRDDLREAFESTDRAEAGKLLAGVLAHEKDEGFQGTVGERLFELAHRYAKIIATVDLASREEYARSLGEIREALRALLGPREGEARPALPREQYGATRWDMAQTALDHLLFQERWQDAGPGQPRQLVRRPREQVFAGTELAELFPYVRDNLEGLLRPRWTFYWRYFLDPTVDGHYFGGLGPEALGTIWITLLTILFALPVGVTAAAYFVECAGDSLVTRMLRTCVNTLAGVPSIVFGLFGLAFFVQYLQPRLGLPSQACILAGSLTLAVLVLPVIIRSSEEAIRAVPPSYREAALSLGASRFRCFMTVTLPAALPGILTGLILSMSRAAGETAPILWTAGMALGPNPRSILDPTLTLTYSSYNMAMQDQTAKLVPHNLFGMVATLVAMVLLLNVVAIWLRGRMSRKLRG